MKKWTIYGTVAAVISALLFPSDGLVVMAVMLGLFILIGYLDQMASELQNGPNNFA